jgi:NADPH2:quinone reductase
MKAIQFSRFGGAEVLEYVDVDEPLPTGNQLVIDVTFAGVNFPDIREREGVYNRAETRVGGVKLPRITGLQAVGRVSALGPDADKSLLGKKVVAYLVHGGGYAQRVIARPEFCVVVPGSADEQQLAAIPCQGLTAYLMLTASTKLKSGESILIHGAAGGVGSIAMQIAKILGAGQIIGTAGSDIKRRYVKDIGADSAVDYGAPDWTDQVLKLTGGRGVDVLLESIGGDVFTENFKCLATFGRYIIFGSTRGPGEPVAPRSLMTKAQSIAGIYLPVFSERPDLVGEGLRFLVDHILDGKVRANIANVLPLSKAAEAHLMLEERRANGIVLLDVSK